MAITIGNLAKYPKEMQALLCVEGLKWRGPIYDKKYHEAFSSQAIQGLYLKFNYGSSSGYEPQYRIFILKGWHPTMDDFLDHLFKIENLEEIVYHLDIFRNHSTFIWSISTPFS